MQAREKGNAQGIDVSRYQGKIDWKVVKADGISFAFIKASQGKSYRDKTFIGNAQAVRAIGVLVGAYHYVEDSAKTPEDARKEAANFVSAIDSVGGIAAFDLPPVMDYESNKPNLSKTTVTAVAKAFLEEVERLTGVRPIVYTYQSFIGNFSGLSGYPLWIARYHATKAPSDASGWSRWDFWQYSDGQYGGTLPSGTRKVSGIAGPVDLNEYSGTVDELRALFTNRPVTPDKAGTFASGTFIANGKEAGKTLLYGSRTYVPLRSLANALGVSYRWDNTCKEAYLNGSKLQTVQLVEDTAYVQLRPIAEAYGVVVSWDSKNKIASLKTKGEK